MKNGINTGQFHVKTGFLGNGRRNIISTSVNTKTGSHKYGNGRTKIENGTGRNRNISVCFQPYSYVLTILTVLKSRLCSILLFLSTFKSTSLCKLLFWKNSIYMYIYSQNHKYGCKHTTALAWKVKNTSYPIMQIRLNITQLHISSRVLIQLENFIQLDAHQHLHTIEQDPSGARDLLYYRHW